MCRVAIGWCPSAVCSIFFFFVRNQYIRTAGVSYCCAQGKSGGNKASSEAAAQDSGDDSAGQQTEPEDDPFSFLKDVGGPAIVFPRNWGDV